jgi:hypothetical protein
LGLVGALTDDDTAKARELLQQFLYLLCAFQRRRKFARAQERRETRQGHAPKLPAPRVDAELVEDTSAPAPDADIIREEEMALLEALLPHMKERDALRLRKLFECHGDRARASAELGMSRKDFSRQLRQTVLPAARKLAQQIGLKLHGESPDPEDL